MYMYSDHIHLFECVHTFMYVCSTHVYDASYMLLNFTAIKLLTPSGPHRATPHHERQYKKYRPTSIPLHTTINNTAPHTFLKLLCYNTAVPIVTGTWRNARRQPCFVLCCHCKSIWKIFAVVFVFHGTGFAICTSTHT